jgi:hypothetical protein
MNLTSLSLLNCLIALFVGSVILGLISNFGFENAFGDSLQKKPFVLINTTDISNCLPLTDGDNSPLIMANDYTKKNNTLSTKNNNINYSKTCSFAKILPADSCPLPIENGSKTVCKSDDIDKYKGKSGNKLNSSNFDENGLLISDTKFNRSYSYEMGDPVNPQNKIGVDMDFQEHIQTQNHDINSPRLKIVREKLDGMPDMNSAKNQEIIWTGNINGFFTEPKGKYQNETYLVLQFNTGRHGSNASDEERGFGVLFDVSNDSNPNLLEYRANKTYIKYDLDKMKQFAGDDFIFHNLDKEGHPLFVNDLLNKEDVKVKVKTYLTRDDKRVIESFIDNGSGVLIPYWTLKDLSKLKIYDRIKDKDGFVEALKQGSGYVIARTDNVDTRASSFRSLVFNIS